MRLFSFLDKKADTRTPILIKVMAVLYAWFIISALNQLVLRRDLPILPAILGIVIQVIVLVAFWNLRRWSVIGFLALTVYGLSHLFMLYGGDIPTNVLLVTALIRGFIIIPGLIYWRSMSW
jgi:hypothetical protein